MMKSSLVRGRPVKRDKQESDGTSASMPNGAATSSDAADKPQKSDTKSNAINATKRSISVSDAKPQKNAGISLTINCDDIADVAFKIDMKRPKPVRKAAAKKKQKVGGGSAERNGALPEVVNLSESAASLLDKDEDEAMPGDPNSAVLSPMKKVVREAQKRDREEVECNLVQSSRIPSHVAHNDYPHRYVKNEPDAKGKAKRERAETEEEKDVAVVGHFKQAEVEGKLYMLGDCVHVYSGLEREFIGRITEFFEKEDKSEWFGVQWFFRSYDTGIGKEGRDHDKRRVYYSDVKDDNPLECIVGKVSVVRVPSKNRFDKTTGVPPKCDYYFDKGYKFAYATFYELPKDLPEPPGLSRSLSGVSTVESDAEGDQYSCLNSKSKTPRSKLKVEVDQDRTTQETETELQLLDLYCGCGAMSTGLCLGTNLAGVNLVTRWAVDLNDYACISLKYNHPETTVRNEAAEDYLELLKEWKKLCEMFPEGCSVDEDSEEEDEDEGPAAPGEYEVERLTGVRWIGEVSNKDKEVMEQVDDVEVEVSEEMVDEQLKNDIKSKKVEVPDTKGLEFKVVCYKHAHHLKDVMNVEKGRMECHCWLYVKWKGYSDEHDSWEPAASLENSPARVREFVLEGRKCKILPLPGDCDVVCGGPPCQGASGFNRFRNYANPLDDPRNKQMVVYMDIVDFLRPRFMLMENVVDILKFCDGILGRYALARAVAMNYQAKIGLMVAGCYGMPQFRMRCFLFGACSTDVLPPYPMPTHSVIVRGGVPNLWERCLVAYEEYKQPEWLQKPLVLKDAMSDLPLVSNSHGEDDILYEEDPHTSFQRFVRLPKLGTGGLGAPPSKAQKVMLPDHCPLCLNQDDYQRVCQIPKRKGANFRDLKGILIKEDGVTVDVVREPRELLPSGKPLVPDYAVSFIRGRSLKPFGRLWWDETVSTVVTRAEPHNQIILHPEQDRVLTIRENARLQGFPDYYKLFGPIKQRYMQVGNAVAVPVATALGYSLGKSFLKECAVQDETIELPRHFPYSLTTPADVPELPDNEIV